MDYPWMLTHSFVLCFNKVYSLTKSHQQNSILIEPTQIDLSKNSMFPEPPTNSLSLNPQNLPHPMWNGDWGM
jgi:hypothetical protein